MDKAVKVDSKAMKFAIIGTAVIMVFIIAGIIGANANKEKEKAEPVTKENAAKVCKDFIFNAGSDSPLYDYVPDALDKPSTLEIGKTKDDVEGFSTSFAGSYFDEKGKITCLIAGTKGDPKVYSITFAGRQIYGDATSWMKPVEEEQE